MGLKRKITRALSQATCDKTELNRTILRFRKCFKEAEAALCGKNDKKKK